MMSNSAKKSAKAGNASPNTSHDGAAHLGRGKTSKLAPKSGYAGMPPASSTKAGVSSFNGASGIGGKAAPTLMRRGGLQTMNTQVGGGKPAGGTSNMKAAPKQLRAGPMAVPTSGKMTQPTQVRGTGTRAHKSVAKAPSSAKRKSTAY